MFRIGINVGDVVVEDGDLLGVTRCELCRFLGRCAASAMNSGFC